MKKSNNPDSGLLTICLLMTLVIAIGAGLLISVESSNPLETLMFYVRDGFTSAVTPDIDGEVLDNGENTEPDFIVPDITFPEETTDEEIMAATHGYSVRFAKVAARFRKELIARYGIQILPLRVSLSDREYTDGIDIDPDMIYRHYEQTKGLPKRIFRFLPSVCRSGQGGDHVYHQLLDVLHLSERLHRGIRF